MRYKVIPYFKKVIQIHTEEQYEAFDKWIARNAQISFNDIDKLRAASQFDDSGNVNIIVLSDTYGTGNSKIKSIKNGN